MHFVREIRLRRVKCAAARGGFISFHIATKEQYFTIHEVNYFTFGNAEYFTCNLHYFMVYSTPKGGGDMKKKIVICVFLTVILITAIFFIAAAIDSYNYDMDPANGVDILEGFGAVLAIMIGAFVVFYELDLFYTVYYFLIKPKTIAKSILNVLANLSLLLVFFGDCYGDIFSEDYIAPIIVFAIYAVLRISCLIIPYRKM